MTGWFSRLIGLAACVWCGGSGNYRGTGYCAGCGGTGQAR